MRVILAAISGLALGSVAFASPAGADAKDIAGKWYRQTGEHVINIYRAGPEYTGEIDRDTVTGAGTIHVEHHLGNFSATANHVHFSDSWTMVSEGADPALGTDTYDFTLSEEGDRLIGTHSQDAPAFGVHNTPPSPYTIYRRE